MMRFNPYRRPFLFQRLALTFGVVQGIWRVWWELQPEGLLFALLAGFAVILAALGDWSLRKLDPYLEKIGTPIGRAVGLGLVFFLSAAIGWITSVAPVVNAAVTLAQFGVPALLGTGLAGVGTVKVVYAFRFPKPLGKTLPAASRPTLRKSSPISSLACLFSPRHGVYRLHAVTQIILIF